MNKSHKRKLLVLGLGVLAATQISYGENITRRDPDAGAPTLGFPSGYHSTNGNDREDNEVENGFWAPGIAGPAETLQKWDLEAMTLDGSKLRLIGGFDFQSGVSGINPGFLFVKVGGMPNVGPTTFGTDTAPNSDFGGTGYTLAININTGEIYDLNSSSLLTTSIFDFYGASPWTVDSSVASTRSVGAGDITFLDDQTAAQIALLTNGEVTGLLGDNVAVDEAVHNVVTIDLSSVLTFVPGTDIWFHYAPECGNDILRGAFHNVPEGGTTALMLGAGFCGLLLLTRRAKTA